MKLYLSGPMTGLPELNYPAFRDATQTLRELKHEVYNPAEWEELHSPDGKFHLLRAFEDYCKFIIHEADGVVVLPGWENSPGATAETALAKAIGKPVYVYQELNFWHK